MISPDDPRHGTNAGAVAHWRAGERPCPACKLGAMRAKKERQLRALTVGEPANVPLGDNAHAIIASTNRKILSDGTGVSQNQLRLYLLDGPGRTVRRTTRDKILAFRRPWTPIGIQRRLRALTLLGWSMQAIADRTGIYMTSLAELRRNEDIKFVRTEVADKILTAWSELCMTPAPDSHSARETAARARGRGWVPVLGWEDIDDPNEDPFPAGDENTVDAVAVQRILAGDWRGSANKAERVEVVRRWRAAGKPVNELARLTGWKVERYYTPANADQEVA